MLNGMQTYASGVLDGDAQIQMNNLAVGYFPSETPEIGVYPAPVPTQFPQAVEAPLGVEPSSGTNS
jgi:hypothetical protein